MNTSPTITKISAALVKAQSEMSNAKKETVNPFFKKTYADLNSIREAALPVLNKHGISAIQPLCVIEGVYFVETILLHESGEFISSLTPVINDKPSDSQRHGSGISYARRYALQSIVNIGAEDDDANAAVAPSKQPAASPLLKQESKPVFDQKKAEEIESFIKGLEVCSTKKDLTEYKKIVPVDIVADHKFIAAAKKRFSEVVLIESVK